MTEFERTYEDIKSRCPKGAHKFAPLTKEVYADRLRGALLSRFAGCTLGAPVEGNTLDMLESHAKEDKIGYPPQSYWKTVPNPDQVRYIYQTFSDYTESKMNGVPCDDDTAYTILSLLIMTESGKGLNFELSDVAKAWQKYITEAYTAEFVALKNLKEGIAPEKSAEVDNPYDDWIGADIRCDGYGYASPCDCEKAARAAYTDAYISHRGEGIYGSVYFAAVISAAFATGNIYDALCEGLYYIPEDCELAAGIKFALEHFGKVKTPREAAALVDARYPGMSNVHTINNACLTVMGLGMINPDRPLSSDAFSFCVAAAHDNDCTAATAGSVAGAAYGMKALEEKWYKPFNGKANIYFNGKKEYLIDELLKGFEKIAFAD